MPTKLNLFNLWINNAAFRRVVYLLLLVLVLVEGYIAVFVRKNDFLVHRYTGNGFLSGKAYIYPGAEIYPLGRMAINSLFTIGPIYWTRTFYYLLAIGVLYGCYVIWKQLVKTETKVSPATPILAALGTLAITLSFLLRDLDECGLQIYLLFFLSAAGYSLAYKRESWSGFWLATATIYKVTPALFLPFLLWKRKFKAAAWMITFIGLWFLLPMLFLGMEKTFEGHQTWFLRASKIASLKSAYPYQGVLEPPRVYNFSLAATIARYVETYPKGHPLYVDHPAFIQFGNLPPDLAYYLVRGSMVLLLLSIAYGFRKRWQENESNVDLAQEWSVICLLCALLAPVCWKQHMVLMLPAMFVLLHSMFSQPKLATRWRYIALGVITLMFYGFRRVILGKELENVFCTFKFDTFGMLILLYMTINIPTQNPLEECYAPREQDSSGIPKAA